MATQTYPQVSDDPAIQARYEACRAAGSDHKTSEMLAFRQGPSLQTDTRFMLGHKGAAAYKSQLARYPGDPEAYVRSRQDCIDVARKRGLTLEGSVNYKPPDTWEPPAEEKPYMVAEDIVEREYAKLHPDEKADKDAKHNLRERLSGR